MKKIIIKAVVLSVIFMAALLIISGITNEGNADSTAEMGSATYPVIYMELDGGKANTLHGYGQEMQGSYVRDTIAPISEDGGLSISIKKNKTEIKTVSYEVRSIDSTRLVEETEAGNKKTENGYIKADLQIKDLLDEGTEYLLNIILETDNEEKIYYYTRIIRKEKLHEGEKLDFIKDFHEKTFNKETARDIVKYLEPKASTSNASFQKVTINSKFDMVTWGSLAPEKVTEPVPAITEIDSSTASVVLSYFVSCLNDSGETDYYKVREFYRVRYTESRMYLLDFERTMDQMFSYENNVFTKKSVNLGIVGEDPDYLSNAEGTIVCFVQNGELWCYDSEKGKLSSVYTFMDEREWDIRNTYDQHGIKLVSMDGAGNAVFMVYGYMNRGIREGSVGVAVYQYSSAINAIEEKVFIPSTKSFQLLKEDIGKLCYINNNNVVYIMMNSTIYSIDLATMEYQEAVSGLGEGSFVISADNHLLAWQEEKQADNSTIVHIRNLDTDEEQMIACNPDERIRPLGFMEEDFIYGIARQADIVQDMAGNTVFPMYVVKIQNGGTLIKEYSQEGIYITAAAIEDNMIRLTRVTKSGAGYAAASDDQIVSNREKEAGSIRVDSAVSDKKKQEILLVFENGIEDLTPKFLTPKEIIYEGSREVALEKTGESSDKYYVYAKGAMEGIYFNAGSAIARAAQLSGVVVTDTQEYVWERGNRKTRTQIDGIGSGTVDASHSSTAVCLNLMMMHKGVSVDAAQLLNEGKTPAAILSENLGLQVIDLTGCELDAALYYVSRGTPVLAMTDAASAVLITGYDELNTIIMNPATGTTYKVGMKDSAAMFQAAGNRFISYIR